MTTQPEPKNSTAQAESVKLADGTSAKLGDILNNLDAPTFFDNGQCFVLIANDHTDGVVYNACYGDYLTEEGYASTGRG